MRFCSSPKVFDHNPRGGGLKGFCGHSEPMVRHGWLIRTKTVATIGAEHRKPSLLVTSKHHNRHMSKAMDPKVAIEKMLIAGLKPLEPYVSTSTPWRARCLKCKSEVHVRLNNLSKVKVACVYCSGNAIHEKDAIAVMKKAGLKPLEPYPGNSKPWKSQCLKCKSTVSPRYKSVSRGQGGCFACGRKKAAEKNTTSSEIAYEIFRKHGLEPLEPFSNSHTEWKAKCMECGKTVSPKLAMVKANNSGCAYCAGRRIDERDAIKVFQENGLKPLIPYPGNKKPWRSIHEPCGKEVSPSYQAIANHGQGACKYCARKAVDPADAEKVFLKNNLKPLVPYPGDNKKPWPSIHLICGNEVSPFYDVVRRGESMGCHFCSDQFVDPEEAFNFFLSKDLQPLTPYPGTNKPWKSIHLICGNVISPRWGHIRAGRVGCPHCAKVIPITQEFAFAFFNSKGLLPQEPFPGPTKAWKNIHTECGKVVTPQWNSVQQGGSGCKYCAKNFVDSEDAIDFMKSKGAIPLVPYPGGDKPWRCKHEKCGKEISPRFSTVRAGQGVCKHCAGTYVDPIEAKQFFISRGLIPKVEYPGANTGWKSIHEVCGNEVSPYFRYVKSGGIGCNFCAGLAPKSKSEVKKLFISRGYKPLDEYVNSKTPIKSIHKVCGKEVSPTYASVRNGRGCKYCQVGGINLLAPAFIYLMTNPELNAHKLGIGGYESNTNRIEQHKKHGWKLFASMDLDTAEEAYEIEQRVLDWIRFELGFGQFLLSEQMPQGGHTETFGIDDIDLSDVWNKVSEMSKMAHMGSND